jgi:predicted phosphoadenosine phosphosulfate sulfurtransferase
MSIRKKQFLEQDVYEKALERIEYCYQTFDKVVVSFSGGKDSTAVLNLTIEVARKLNRLPVDVYFFDEEAVHPPTIEYVQRTMQKPEVRLHWYCLQFKHRNACSNTNPYWYCWDEDHKDLWVRQKPDCAISSHAKFEKGMSFQDWSPFITTKSDGRTAMLTGIRTEESLRRYQVIARKKNDAFLNSKSEKKTNQYRAHPIYDWSSEDVWLVVTKNGWDYNKTYDIFNQTKLYNQFLKQRVCPPYGEEPLRGLWVYAECFPELWHKMLYRVDGVATAWRYGNTELYSNSGKKPDNMTYEEYLPVILDSYDPEWKDLIIEQVDGYKSLHFKKTSNKIDDETPHPISGVSWKFLCNIAIRGDLKGRQGSKLNAASNAELNKLGITLEQAKKIYR